MEKNLQKDIFDVLQKHNRYDLITMILTLIQEIDYDTDDEDDDFEYEEEDEPREEYNECGSIPEDPSFCISHDGFYYLK